MSENEDTLWTVTFLSQRPGEIIPHEPLIIRALTCEEENGTLVFKSAGGGLLSIKAIIASERWLWVEKEEDKRE